MAVVVTSSFTSDVQSGESPLVVQFTDTTTVSGGFARSWIWDFDDGTVSTEQNPEHTFTDVPGTIFSVTLTVLATETELQALSYVDWAPTRLSNTRLTGVDADVDLAWSSRSSAPQDDAFVYHHLNYNGAQYFYFTNEAQLQFVTYHGDVPFCVLMMENHTDIATIYGAAQINGVSVTPTTTGSWEVHSRLNGLTSTNPITTTGSPNPEIPIPYTIGDGVKGFKTQFVTRSYPDGPTQSFGDATSNITLGEAYIDFVGTPLTGTSPLAVQFTDLSKVDWAWSVWDFGDGNTATFAGETHPLNTYTTDSCSIDLL